MKLGVLGAGQLARMLVEAALLERSAEPVVISDSSLESVSNLNVESRPLKPGSFKDLDFITFENEFVNVGELRSLGANGRFFPSLDVIEVIQNKLEQKKLLDRLRLPTATWRKVEVPSDVNKEEWSSTVLKWARLGYDGKGTLFPTGPHEVEEFFAKSKTIKSEIYSEQRIRFRMEGALISARNWSGDIIFYPVVQTHQRRGICHHVEGGASFLKELEERIQPMALQIMDELNYVGILAIEFFLTTSGEIVINELAPRVHNSGHFTQLACNISQFESHVRSGLDNYLVRPKLKAPYFGMWNLVPEWKGRRSYSVNELPPLDGDDYQLYWYYKSELRSGRKMGHINFLAQTENELRTKERYLANWEKIWNEAIKKKS